MEIGIYSICHMLVDGLCAFAMFGIHIPTQHGYWNILLYNLCAFAMQMPLGAVLDWQLERSTPKAGTSDTPAVDWCRRMAMLGIVLVGLGVFMNPVLLGMGNALFHVGGGVRTILLDRKRQYRGAGLGIFVAPGAFGLMIGQMVAANWLPSVKAMISAPSVGAVWILVSFMLVLCRSVPGQEWISAANITSGNRNMEGEKSWKNILLILCCFLVVILRSYVGMNGQYGWKTTQFLQIVAVLAVVLGKICGGLLAARVGIGKTVCTSLILAMICFLGCQSVLPGIGALFFFNMTMPITLYLLARRFLQMPGFFFGLLTFALFLGFLPVYFGWNIGMPTSVMGCVGSGISLLLLVVACLC